MLTGFVGATFLTLVRNFLVVFSGTKSVFVRVNKFTMGISFAISWFLYRLLVGSFLCGENRFAHDIFNTMDDSDAQSYFDTLTPICHLEQAVIDSRFIWSQMTFKEAFIYSGIIAVAAALLEFAFVYFKKDKFIIHDETNGLFAFVFYRVLLFAGFTMVAIIQN